MGLLSISESFNRWLVGPDVLPRLQRLAILYGLLFLATNVVMSWLNPGLAYGARGVIGADFLAFYTAGDMTLQGRALEAYDFEAFDTALQTRVANEHLGMMWQYPPLVFFLAGGLALIPYKLSLWMWIAVTCAVFAWALNRIAVTVAPEIPVRRVTLLLILTAPICLAVVTSGQISLLTAALLMTAAFRPRTDWLLAGLAAGLLTFKPQLGVLLPLAYLVAGAWRAFGVAAVTAIVIHGISVLMFGPEAITAFFNAVVRLQSDVAGSGTHTPPVNMTTLFGQLRYWDVPSTLATPLHLAMAAMVVVTVVYLWRRYKADEVSALLLTSLLGAGAILVTPYAYAYEMTSLAPAAIWMAFQPGRYSRVAALILVGAWLALTLRAFAPLDAIVQMPFLVSVGAFTLLAYAGMRPAASEPTRRA